MTTDTHPPRGRERERGFGYATAPLRVEHRPQLQPFSREQVTAWLDFLQSCGIRAWWYSVAAPHANLLYRSRWLPCLDQAADADYYRWVADQAHRRGIAVLSHLSLASSPLSIAAHPNWAMVLLGEDEAGVEAGGGRSDRFPCFNSPFRDRLTALVVEVVEELGFDGFWFDSTALGWPDAPGCVCPRCRERFRADTGLEAPRRIDFDDHDFRRWFRWRQAFWMDCWAELIAAVRRRRPRALLALKCGCRVNHTGETAVPLRRLPAGALIPNEVDWRPNQCLLQMKCQRAMMAGAFAPETWLGMSDGTALWRPKGPEPEPAGLILFGLTCMTGGGYPSLSGGEDDRHCLRAVADRLNPVAPYVGGEPVRFAGLVVSGATNDFAHRVGSDRHARREAETWRGALPDWRAVHGMHYVLNALHLPSEVLLEDDLTAEGLAAFAVVVMSDVQCLADEQAAALERYVASGGVLLATGETGVKDEWGLPRERGALDELFGIAGRFEAPAHIVLGPLPAAFRDAGLPERCMVSGRGRLAHLADGATPLAEGQIVYPRFRSTPTHTFPADPPPETRGAAIVERRIGRGAALWLAPNVGFGYSENPNRRTRALVGALLGRHAAPPYEVVAPWNVAATAWRQEGRWVFHLLNQPHGYCRLDEANLPLHPEDTTPTGPVVLRLGPVFGEPADVHSPTGGRVTWQKGEGGVEVRLERLEVHHVVVCRRAD